VVAEGPPRAGALPAGSIDAPKAGSAANRGPLIVLGWALGPEGPVADALVLVDGGSATAARTGVMRADVRARHGEVEGADRAGWEAQVDLRGVHGSVTRLTLVARTAGGDWVELDQVELRVEQPGALAARRRAVFTIVQNERRFLPLWLRYYRRHFEADDVYVLDHDSSDGATEGVQGSCNVVAVHRDHSFDHMWLVGVVEDFQAFLLRSYRTVLFAEADEFVVADPARYDGLAEYIEAMREPVACCTGYNVVHYPDEAPLRFDEPVLRQRANWHPSPQYSKRLLARIPLSWNVGFHGEFNAPTVRPDPELLLVHLHRADFDTCLERHRAAASRPWPDGDLRWNLGWHQRVVETDEFRNWFFHGEDLEGRGREPIPKRLRGVL
jgi:hypothetical protein